MLVELADLRVSQLIEPTGNRLFDKKLFLDAPIVEHNLIADCLVLYRFQ